MKKIILLTAFICSIFETRSQDLIVKNDSSKLKTVISEINSECVKYSLFNYPDAPSIVIRKTDIAYIIFKNGTIEHYNDVIKNTTTGQAGPDKYNLDGSLPQIIEEDLEKPKFKRENLYRHRNYIGFNYLALLNSNLSFTYMRDFIKQGFILQLPFSFGIGSPNITNSVYGANYLNSNSRSTYNLMNYQVGAAMLFSPTLTSRVNFLIGPSFSFSQYDMSTKAVYQVLTGQQYQFTNEIYTNNFTLFRQQYGGNIGFLARMSDHFNMSLLLTLGCKKDTYSEKDPYGIEYINTKVQYQWQKNDNVLPYATFAWTMGYRF